MEPSDPDCVESSSPFKTTDDWRHKLAGLQRSESDSCPSTDISLIEWGLPKDFGDVESEAPSSTWGLDPNLTLNEHLLSSVPSPASDNLDTIPPGSDHDLTLGINDVNFINDYSDIFYNEITTSNFEFDFGAEFSDIFNSTCASENFEEDSSNEQNEPFGPVLPVDTNNNGINYDHLYDCTNDKKSGHCSLDKKEVGSNEHKTLLSEHSEVRQTKLSPAKVLLDVATYTGGNNLNHEQQPVDASSSDRPILSSDSNNNVTKAPNSGDVVFSCINNDDSGHCSIGEGEAEEFKCSSNEAVSVPCHPKQRRVKSSASKVARPKTEKGRTVLRRNVRTRSTSMILRIRDLSKVPELSVNSVVWPKRKRKPRPRKSCHISKSVEFPEPRIGPATRSQFQISETGELMAKKKPIKRPKKIIKPVKDLKQNESSTTSHNDFLTALAEVKCSLSEIEQTVAVWQCVAAMADSKRAFELMERVRTLCKTLRWIIGQNRRRSRLQTEAVQMLGGAGQLADELQIFYNKTEKLNQTNKNNVNKTFEKLEDNGTQRILRSQSKLLDDNVRCEMINKTEAAEVQDGKNNDIGALSNPLTIEKNTEQKPTALRSILKKKSAKQSVSSIKHLTFSESPAEIYTFDNSLKTVSEPVNKNVEEIAAENSVPMPYENDSNLETLLLAIDYLSQSDEQIKEISEEATQSTQRYIMGEDKLKPDQQQKVPVKRSFSTFKKQKIVKRQTQVSLTPLIENTISKNPTRNSSVDLFINSGSSRVDSSLECKHKTTPGMNKMCKVSNLNRSEAKASSQNRSIKPKGLGSKRLMHTPIDVENLKKKYVYSPALLGNADNISEKISKSSPIAEHNPFTKSYPIGQQFQVSLETKTNDNIQNETICVLPAPIKYIPDSNLLISVSQESHNSYCRKVAFYNKTNNFPEKFTNPKDIMVTNNFHPSDGPLLPEAIKMISCQNKPGTLAKQSALTKLNNKSDALNDASYLITVADEAGAIDKDTVEKEQEVSNSVDGNLLCESSVPSNEGINLELHKSSSSEKEPVEETQVQGLQNACNRENSNKIEHETRSQNDEGNKNYKDVKINTVDVGTPISDACNGRNTQKEKDFCDNSHKYDFDIEHSINSSTDNSNDNRLRRVNEINPENVNLGVQTQTEPSNEGINLELHKSSSSEKEPTEEIRLQGLQNACKRENSNKVGHETRSQNDEGNKNYKDVKINTVDVGTPISDACNGRNTQKEKDFCDNSQKYDFDIEHSINSSTDNSNSNRLCRVNEINPENLNLGVQTQTEDNSSGHQSESSKLVNDQTTQTQNEHKLTPQNITSDMNFHNTKIPISITQQAFKGGPEIKTFSSKAFSSNYGPDFAVCPLLPDNKAEMSQQKEISELQGHRKNTCSENLTYSSCEFTNVTEMLNTQSSVSASSSQDIVKASLSNIKRIHIKTEIHFSSDVKFSELWTQSEEIEDAFNWE